VPRAEGVIECSSNSSLYLRTVVESTTETFICRSDIQDAFKGLPHFVEEEGDEPSVHKYNELATLMHVSGARHLRASACCPHAHAPC
jgi:hypothetical protein